jgi:glucose/arabinose dehydrogenase
LEDAFPGLQFEQPVAIANIPGDKSQLFVVERSGRIEVVTGLNGPSPSKHVFLDLTKPRDGKLDTNGECGLLGLAFPPDYAKAGRFYAYYSLKIDGKLYERLSRFSVSSANTNQSDAASEQPLWTQLDPAENHNGGDLHFGPDGYLYVSLGDGGAAGDRFDNARYVTKGFHAGILRLDVDKRKGSLPPNPHPGIARDANGEALYAVPRDNPFVGVTIYHGQAVDQKAVRTEFWATGLRNPWRFSFDPATGRLFAGDVGQDKYEEVDIITKGGDYGWSYREGTHPFTTGPGKDQEPAGFKPIEPIFDYSHKVGICIIGGVVYRGEKFADIQGVYLCADFGTGLVMGLRDCGTSWTAETLTREAGIAGVGVDPRDGSVLFASFGQGKIKRLKRGT